jgi:hypothetical protein
MLDNVLGTQNRTVNEVDNVPAFVRFSVSEDRW